MNMPKARSIAVFQSFNHSSELTLTLVIDASKDREKVTIPNTAFALVAPLEMPLTKAISSQIIKPNIKKIIVDTKIIFTKANSDTDGRIINSMIDNYVNNHDNTISFSSMGQLNYLSALQFVDAVVGNSSSGLLEAPSFKIGTIDIGDRQKGRIKADSVIS